MTIANEPPAVLLHEARHLFGDGEDAALPSAGPASGIPSAVDWARARDTGWRHDARPGRTAYAIRPVGDGRLVVVAVARRGTIERRERIGLATALFIVLVGAMGCALLGRERRTPDGSPGWHGWRDASRAAT